VNSPANNLCTAANRAEQQDAGGTLRAVYKMACFSASGKAEICDIFCPLSASALPIRNPVFQLETRPADKNCQSAVDRKSSTDYAPTLLQFQIRRIVSVERPQGRRNFLTSRRCSIFMKSHAALKAGELPQVRGNNFEEARSGTGRPNQGSRRYRPPGSAVQCRWKEMSSQRKPEMVGPAAFPSTGKREQDLSPASS
jgi:hypothetical protein